MCNSSEALTIHDRICLCVLMPLVYNIRLVRLLYDKLHYGRSWHEKGVCRDSTGQLIIWDEEESYLGERRNKMKKFSYTVKDEVGIHARPAGLLVKEAKKYSSKVTIHKEGKSADAGNLMAVMALGVKCGQTVDVEIEGEDEDTAFEALKGFFESNL